MTYINAGTLGVVPGGREQLVSILTQRSDLLRELGCLSYEVGINDEQPATVFVVETWVDAAAHQASLGHPDVAAAIAAAKHVLDGEFSGFRFDVVGSPLRDHDAR
ncbi:putative quinol monooxygenase [Brachybacterium sp. FME24]|uniref:putative quinol monooxygenase n=1 Tax=Brachybacterium sp. FME24 TaxID=2742605 RepID=UPI001866EA30|nr:antibiotic biosynthesis monooxygenase family protein [Brachybacterium sp. FME24]